MMIIAAARGHRAHRDRHERRRVHRVRQRSGRRDHAACPAADVRRAEHEWVGGEPAPARRRARAGRVHARRLGIGRIARTRPFRRADPTTRARAPVRQLRPGHRARGLGGHRLDADARGPAPLGRRARLGHGGHRRARALTASADRDRGSRRERLDIAASARALADRRIDAFFWSGGLPTAASADLQDGVSASACSICAGWPRSCARPMRPTSTRRAACPAGSMACARRSRPSACPNLLVVRSDLDRERRARRFRPASRASRWTTGA